MEKGFEQIPVALQRCDQFVGRTENWLYDHLRCVPGYKPVVICDALQNREEFPDLQAWCWDPQRLRRRIWRRLAGSRPFTADVRRVRRLSPRLLHSHFGYRAVADHELQETLKIPWVVSFYGADAYQLGRQKEWQEMYARLFERAGRVLVLGPVMAAHLESLGCKPEKIVIHSLGVDVKSLPSQPRVLQPGEPLKVLFAGTFREKKGVQYVIRAARLAQQAGLPIEVHLAGDEMGKPGDNETKKEVFQEIRGFGLDPIVKHHSVLRFQELIALALQLHVFVAPSVTAADGDSEGTPFVLQQMLATGMPAIATRHSDIPHIFGEQAHLLVPERDPQAIAERLQRYFKEPETLVSDGLALRERMRSSFDVRQCATRLKAIYDTV